MCWSILFAIFVIYYILDRLIRSQKVGGFAKKYVFITGCDSGFGQALALRLDSMGFPVFAGCLTNEGQQLLTEKASSRLTTLTVDVTKTESISEAFDVIKSKLPQNLGLWAIVNNAGIGGPVVPVEFCTLDEYVKTFAINAFGPFEICRKFLPLIRQEKGRVVNMVSVMGRIACVASPYNASKFAMEGFSDCLRREVADQGIKVSIIEPGFFKTTILNSEVIQGGVKKAYDRADEEVKAAYPKTFIEDSAILVNDFNNKANPKVELVIDSYVHAIVSKYPRTRYVVGWDSKLLFVPLTYLPTGIADWILATFRSKTIEYGRK